MLIPAQTAINKSLNIGNFNRRGFTIVELLIVIVVIGILAAIVIVAYNGVQTRAQDSKRASDLASIEKSIQIYDELNGGVPSTSTYTDTSTSSGWDYSRNADWLSFLRAQGGRMPTDPVNQVGTSGDPSSAGSRQYYYFCYSAGTAWSPDPSVDLVVIGYTKSNGSATQKRIKVADCT